MLDKGESFHTLQTWDATRGVWLDPERALKLETTEATQKAVQETITRVQMEVRMENLVLLLGQHIAQGQLPQDVPDILVAAWQKARWVPDVADAVDVLLGTEDWSTLLPPGDHRT